MRSGLPRAQRWLAGLALGLWAFACAAAPQSVLRYGMLAEFPPFQIWPEGSDPGGADLEMLRRLAPALGARVEPVRYTDFVALERDLRAGRLDLASSMARNAAREQALAFSAPYALIEQAVVTRASEPTGSLVADLNGRRLATVPGYAAEANARELFPLAQRVPVASIADGLRAVQQGRADVMVEAQPVLIGSIERERLAGLRLVRTLALPSGALHFAAPKAGAARLDSLSAALAGMGAETREFIIARWSAEPHFARRAEPLRLDDTERALLAAQRPLNVAVVDGRLPFALVDADGRPQGLSVDVLRAMLGRLGLAPGTWRASAADDVLAALQRGEIDLALGLSAVATPGDAVHVIGPYIEHPMVLLGRPGGSAWGLDQLVGRRLALLPAHFARPLIAARYPGIELVACDPLPNCVERVARGGADAALADVVTAAVLLAESPRSDVQITGAVAGLRQEHGIAVSPRHVALLPLLQRALDATVADDLPELKRRWLTRPTPARIVRELLLRYLPWAAAVLALLMAAWWWHSRGLRREMQRTLGAQRQAERARGASERFTTFLAHEVRNSLHSVIAGAELLRSGRDASASVAGSLGDSARSTLNLLNNLLDRNRLDAGRLSLHLEPAQLGPLLRGVCAEMLPAARARQLALRCESSAPDPLLRVDALRVEQIVRNLVANAIKYSERGEIVIEARCTPQAGDEASRCVIELRVRDQGPGIAEADQARLFERYYTAGGRTAARSGTGLGLSLCRDLAALMGGALHLESTPGRGTTALLRWTADVETEATGPAPLGEDAPRRLLLVEDADVYAMLIERALAEQGYTVQVAGSLAEAQAALAAPGPPFDVVLTDLNLGDGDAQGVIAAVRAGTSAGLPAVVVMSADVDPERVATLREAGAEALLQKTGDVTLLVRQLLAHVNTLP
ncbi:transporter substrate-binding domain-containing protein [Methylibium sp.]|jgi:signal transduction histidine kinase|uniref:transporter substrate-binding domain-containing protein n=1 Tax=Methylibium sp. TaxID=2067992 RepID=UPI003D143312